MFLALSIAVSCAVSDDASRYVSALDAAPDGLSQCAAIRSADLKSDCIAWNARALLRHSRRAEAEAACRQLSTEAWRGECFFQLADQLSAHAADALGLCEHSGTFVDWCRNHVIRRRLEAGLGELGRGEEWTAEQQAREEAALVLSPTAAQETARRVISRAIAARPDRPFDRDQTCGTAPRQTCTAALEERLLATAWAGASDPAVVVTRLTPLCQRPLSATASGEAGFVRWTASSSTTARQAWARVCERIWRSAADPQQLLRPTPLPSRSGTPG